MALEDRGPVPQRSKTVAKRVVAADLFLVDRYIEDLVEGDPFALDADGTIAIPSGPGLGIQWSEAGIEKHTGMTISPQVTGVAEPSAGVAPNKTAGHKL